MRRVLAKKILEGSEASGTCSVGGPIQRLGFLATLKQTASDENPRLLFQNDEHEPVISPRAAPLRVNFIVMLSY